MKIQGQVAVVTGAASGIGQAVAAELACRKLKGLAMVDRSETLLEVAENIQEIDHFTKVKTYLGDVTSSEFRRKVFREMEESVGRPTICVPAAGITRDRLAVRIDKEKKEADVYPIEEFMRVIEINLVASVYWALEMVKTTAQWRWKTGLKRWTADEGDPSGVVIFIGSVSSLGNRGQIAYAAAKAGLEGAASTLTREAMFHGVRCGVIHPGFTDTAMVRALGPDFVKEHILPATQLGRLIRPQEIADAICFMISNPAVTGELWADAGWHPDA